MKNFAKSAALFIVPIMLISGAIFLYINLRNTSPAILKFITYAPYILFFIAAVISWRFNKSRVFFCVLVMSGAYFIMKLNFTDEQVISFFLDQVQAFIGFYIILNILIFTLLKERGILTIWGLIKFLFVLTQSLIIIWFIDIKVGQSQVVFFDFIYKPSVYFKYLPFITVTLSAIVMIMLLVRSILYKSYVDIGFTAAIIMTFMAISQKNNNVLVSVLMGFSALALIIAVIQESYFMAFMDELTGLPSRRALKHELMKLSGRYTIAMLDIDFFKKFNDTYGHDVGDQVLRMVASVMMHVSGGGKAFRYGGEEFTIVFPGKGLNDALPHLEELRENISKRGFTQRSKNRPKKKTKKISSKSGGGKQLFVTASIGMAEKNDKYRKTEEVQKAADKALYRAKKKGRNCVSK